MQAAAPIMFAEIAIHRVLDVVKFEVPTTPRCKITEKRHGSQISDESVPGIRLFILGTGPEN